MTKLQEEMKILRESMSEMLTMLKKTAASTPHDPTAPGSSPVVVSQVQWFVTIVKALAMAIENAPPRGMQLPLGSLLDPLLSLLPYLQSR